MKAGSNQEGKSDLRIVLVNSRVSFGLSNLLFKTLVRSTIAWYLHRLTV